MKTVLMTIICACFLHFAGQAQINLVLNPDFEQYTHCPDNIDEAKYCNHWRSLDSGWTPPDWAHVSGGIPEYCHSCSADYSATVPINAKFRHYPRSGNGMMEVQMYYIEDTFFNSHDYLQGTLSNTLAIGHKYSVLFYTSSIQYNYYSVNRMGAYLDDGTIDTTHHPGWTQTQYIPQIVDTNIIDDTLNWIRVDGTFTANGTEKYITIGNFSDTAHIHKILAPLYAYTALAASWYLIDDVSVIDCSNIPYAGHDTVLMHPGDSAFIGPHESLLPYTWYKLGVASPIDSGGGIWVHPTVTTTYILEQKLCGRTTYDTVKVRVWPDTTTAIETIRQFDNLTIYPNPTAQSLTIEHAARCRVVFYDLVGREVMGFDMGKDKVVVDISSLLSGVYFVCVVDGVTGEKIVKRVLKE